jgi:hypothetical protein
MGVRQADEVVPVRSFDGVVGVEGDTEEDEICVGGDDLGPCAAKVQARAVDTEVGDKWRADDAEGHLDRQAADRGALGAGVVAEVGDVASLVEEDQA